MLLVCERLSTKLFITLCKNKFTFFILNSSFFI